MLNSKKKAFLITCLTIASLLYGMEEEEYTAATRDLFWAIRDKRDGLIKLAIDRGADLTYQGSIRLRGEWQSICVEPPLIFAAKCNNSNAVELLLTKGVSASAVDSDNQETALHKAAEKGFIGIMGILIKAGANIEAERFDGKRPLHTAAQYGKKEAVRLLLNAGADVDAVYDGDITALYAGVIWCNSSVVNELIKKGADVNHVTKQGATPLSMLCYLGICTPLREKILKIADSLLAAGAKPTFEALENAIHQGGIYARFDLVERLLQMRDMCLLLESKPDKAKSLLETARTNNNPQLVKLLQNILDKGVTQE